MRGRLAMRSHTTVLKNRIHADCILMHRHRFTGHHALQLYDRVKAKKCHGKAAVAVARHLAESSWWILRKREKYRQPHAAVGSSSKNG